MINISVSLPKKRFSDKKWADGIASALKKKTAPRLKALFRQSTYGWSNHPSFRQKLTRTADYISMEVYTNDINYALVNAGSPPHHILPRKSGFMRFKPGYRAATTPGSLQSRRAYRSGKFISPVWSVSHPGFAPRKFDELVAKEYSRDFAKDILSGLWEAAKG